MRKYRIIFFLASLSAFTTLPSVSTTLPDTLGVNTAVLSVRHFNSDAYPDTLIAKQVVYTDRLQRSGYKATEIHWGYTSGTPHISYFSYPSWTELKTSASVTQLNDDNSYDIILTMSGAAIVGITPVPQAKVVSIFGCEDLFLSDTIKLSIIDTLQHSPYPATKLVMGTDIIEGAYRDFSPTVSYRLADIAMTIDSLSAYTMPSGISEETVASTFMIYPNPAVRYAIIEGKNIAPGKYQLRLLNTAGRSVRDVSFSVSYFGSFTEKFNLEELASGHYILQIMNEKGVYSSHPLIVVD